MITNELSAKVRLALWWIASIAASVLCCSILFVFFASYLVDVKAALRESNERLSIVEDRQTRILNEMQLVRLHAVFQQGTNAAQKALPSAQPQSGTPSVGDAPSQPASSNALPIVVPEIGSDKAVQAPTELVPADKKVEREGYMAISDIISTLNSIASDQGRLAQASADLARQAQDMAAQSSGAGQGFFITGLTVFVLACFVGYYVVWRVTPALHSPLMAVTNAVSSVIIVGALLAAGPVELSASRVMGLVAVILASVNIFGGFIVTQRMLAMYKKKTPVVEKGQK